MRYLRDSLKYVGIPKSFCRLIPTSPKEEDIEFLRRADIILIAGGNVKTGIGAFEKSGLNWILPQKKKEGALIVGIAEGAIILGAKEWKQVLKQHG